MVQTVQDLKQVYVQAMQRLSGQGREPSKSDFNSAVSDLRHAAALLPPAQAMLATLVALGCEGKPDDDLACEMFLKSAMSGYPVSLRGLGVCLLLEPETQDLGAALLKRAVSAGDWVAAFLILREAMRGRYLASRSDLLEISGMLSPSVPFHAEIKIAMAHLDTHTQSVSPAHFVQAVCEKSIKQTLSYMPDKSATHLHNAPRIAVYMEALPPLLCDYLIATSTALMQPSKVVDANEAGAVNKGYRTSDGAVLLPAQMDFVHVCILRRLSALAGIEPAQGEFLSLLRYKPGQEYRPHHDYLKEDANDYSKVRACGQRSKTLLTYLNDGYEGGATDFPELSITHAGDAGSALLFENTEIAGQVYETSLHAGTPVSFGEKWLATLWCRERPFWPWMRA